MSKLHKPVLLNECLENLRSLEGSKNKWMDGTFGRGGHTLEILKAFPGSSVVAFDRDKDAINYGKESLHEFVSEGRLELVQENFSHIGEEFPDVLFDGILVDLGVSSPQLDNADRGFSFYNSGPLDMRMNQSDELTASTVVNEWSKEDLVDIFKKYGEVRSPFKVVDRICERRSTQPFTTTTDLSDFIASVTGWRKKGHHPATQFFLALRIVVNNEVDFLKNAMIELIKHLRPKGRLLVITFHSIEDRIVKYIFKEDAIEFGSPLFKKVIKPTREEEVNNPRSRSAKLRVFERNGVEQ